MLLEFPAVIAWVNGHTHINTIQSHANGEGGGFWEITAASCVDFPQQQQLIEVVDNRDGTLSIFTTTLDHASDAIWAQGRSLADRSRIVEQAAVGERLGRDARHETRLADGSQLRAARGLPFDLSLISDADLEKVHARRACAAAGL